MSLLIAILVAIVAYWLIVPVAGLPMIVGAVAAILILIGGVPHGEYRGYRRW